MDVWAAFPPTMMMGQTESGGKPGESLFFLQVFHFFQLTHFSVSLGGNLGNIMF